jgi:hypothetical protein
LLQDRIVVLDVQDNFLALCIVLSHGLRKAMLAISKCTESSTAIEIISFGAFSIFLECVKYYRMACLLKEMGLWQREVE